jgi:predicted RNase H-like HicB family nuclease
MPDNMYQHEKGGDQMSHKVSIVIEKDEQGYYAYAPELEGCQTQGDSLEEAIENAREAVALYLETLSADEIKELLSKEILTTTIEVQVA